MESEQDWTLRALRESEVEAAARFWAIDNNFDIGVELFHRWFRVDPGAFQVVIDKQHRVIGTGCAVRQTDSMYFIGLVAVSKEYRGKGIAKKILATLHARCPTANYGLSSVPEIVPMYERLGYTNVGTPYAFIYIGSLKGPLKRLLPERDPRLGVLTEVTRLDNELNSKLIEYDQQAHGFRRDVIGTLVDDPTGIVLAVLRAGAVIGFGKVQKNLRDAGAWFGPMYADDIVTAKWLFDELLRRFEAEARISMYLVVSEQAKSLAESFSLACIEKSPRCYLKPEPEHRPPMKVDKLFIFDSLDFCLM